jgi:hypothetical protein
VKLKVVKVDGKESVVKEVEPNDVVDTIIRAWDDVVESLTQDSYASAVMRLRDVCKKFPKFLDYVQSKILNIVNEKSMRACIDRVLHLGCRTTNRVEGANGRLKKYWSNSVGDLGTWEKYT